MIVKVITPNALARLMYPDWAYYDALSDWHVKQVDDWHQFINGLAEDFLEGAYFYPVPLEDCIQWRSRLGAACEFSLVSAPEAVVNEIIDMIYPKLSTLPIWTQKQ